VRFDGSFKPGWFRHSHFEARVFPRGLTEALLVAGDNSFENGIW
jgi:hypothetical protein